MAQQRGEDMKANKKTCKNTRRLLAVWLGVVCMLLQACTSEAEIAISKNELEFYQNFIRADGIQNMEEASREYAKEIYAKVDLAKEYGVIDQYSLEQVLKECESVDAENQKKLAEGQTVMGLIEFTPQEYFPYYLAELKANTIKAISQKPNQEILEEAANYQKKNKEDFVKEVTIEYQFTPFDETLSAVPRTTIHYNQLQLLSRVNSELYGLLLHGEINKELLKADGVVQIFRREMTYYNFPEDQEWIVQQYLSNEKYQKLVDETKAKIQLVFES